MDPHELVSAHADAILEKVFGAISVAAKVRARPGGGDTAMSGSNGALAARPWFRGSRVPRGHHARVRRARRGPPEGRGADPFEFGAAGGAVADRRGYRDLGDARGTDVH